MEATAGVGDVQVFAERDVMHEDEANTMGMHPLLPANMHPVTVYSKQSGCRIIIILVTQVFCDHQVAHDQSEMVC